ncbi:hypothetical protein Psyaliredsea_18680 [Psychrobacter alimentarius]
MSNEHAVENSATPFDVIIERIDIKGQYIQLADPVHLSGQLNVSELRTQYSINSKEDLAQLALQIGVDEAGRGPLLGSVNVAAAILPSAWSGLIENQPLKDTPLFILTDSKQLSEKSVMCCIRWYSNTQLGMWLQMYQPPLSIRLISCKRRCLACVSVRSYY